MEGQTERELILNHRKRALVFIGILIMFNFINLIFAACFLNSLGYTSNYIPDLNDYWQNLLKAGFKNKQLPIDSFLVGNLTLIAYGFHQMNFIVLAWQLHQGGIIKRIKFESEYLY